jgi:ABC-type Na+ transport system ATPase subunit NatA
MGYTKERVKLEKLLVKLNGVNNYDEKSSALLFLTQEQYSHTVRILKNKEPEVFTSHYTDELQAIKLSKNLLKDSDTDELKQQNFTSYKEVIIKALQKTISAALAIV